MKNWSYSHVHVRYPVYLPLRNYMTRRHLAKIKRERPDDWNPFRPHAAECPCVYCVAARYRDVRSQVDEAMVGMPELPPPS